MFQSLILPYEKRIELLFKFKKTQGTQDEPLLKLLHYLKYIIWKMSSKAQL